MDTRIEVVYADGTSESFVLDKEEMVLGRSVEANIAIPDARELEPQHLMLKPQQNGCWVAVAQGATTPAIVSGREFNSGVLPWGTEIQLGPLVIVLTGEDAGAKKTNIGQWVLGLVVIGLCFGGYVWYASRSPIDQLEPPKDYPTEREIMPPTAACSVPQDAAETRGKSALNAALAKSDRYPFDAQDGIQAIYLFSEALDCFKRSGNTAMASRASREGRAMQQRIVDDYRTRRLSLELALENKNLEEAATELSHLYRLVQHTGGTYKAELARIGTMLSMELQKRDKKGRD